MAPKSADALGLETDVSNCRHPRQSMTVYRLPPEILADIFFLVQAMAADSWYDDRYSVIKRLSGVSSYWYQTVLSIPQLWVIIDGSYHPTFVKSIIQRSKALPLHIRISPDRSEDKKRNIAFLDAIIPCIARWKTFRCLSSDITRTLSQRHVKEQATILELFEASPTSMMPPLPDLPAWLLHSAPRLHTLSLSLSSFSLGAPFLGNLRNIRFCPSIRDTPFTSNQWQEFFSAAPNLESIIIHERNWCDPPILSPIRLPHLKSLIFSSAFTTTVAALLSSIIPSADTYPLITIERPYDVTDEEIIFDTMFAGPPATGSLLSLTRYIRWMTLSWYQAYGYNYPRVKAGVEENKYFLALHPVSSTLLTSSMITPLSVYLGPQLEGLEIGIDRAEDIWGLTEILPAFRNLRNLSILGAQYECNALAGHDSWYITPDSEPVLLFPRSKLFNIMRVLSVPKKDGSEGDCQWPCPKLKYLRVDSSASIEMMILFVKTRYGSHTFSSVNRPTPLEVLRLSNTGHGQSEQQSVNRLEVEVKMFGGVLQFMD